MTNVDLGDGQIIVVDADNAGLIVWYSPQGFKSTGGQKLRLYVKVATATKYPSGNSARPSTATTGSHFDARRQQPRRC